MASITTRTAAQIAADLKQGLAGAAGPNVGILRSDLAALAKDSATFAGTLVEGYVDDGKSRVVHVTAAALAYLVERALSGSPASAAPAGGTGPAPAAVAPAPAPVPSGASQPPLSPPTPPAPP